jgi:hypothetical protein
MGKREVLKMEDEPKEIIPEEPQEQTPDHNQALKNEIKNELKEEYSQIHRKRKKRVIYSIGIFALGLVIGFGGGMATHHEHHLSHGHFQKWHHVH